MVDIQCSNMLYGLSDHELVIEDVAQYEGRHVVFKYSKTYLGEMFMLSQIKHFLYFFNDYYDGPLGKNIRNSMLNTYHCVHTCLSI